MQVVGARGDISRLVVVDEDDAARVALDRLAEQLAHPHEDGRDVPEVEDLLGHDGALGVEHKHDELLALEAAELRDQSVSDVGWMADVPAGADRRELETAAAVRTRCGRGRTVPDDSDEPRRGVAGSLVDPAVPRR